MYSVPGQMHLFDSVWLRKRNVHLRNIYHIILYGDIRDTNEIHFITKCEEIIHSIKHTHFEVR